MSRLRRRVADTSGLFQRAPVRVRLVPFNVSFIVASCDEVFPAYSSSFHDCLNFQLLAGARDRRPYSEDSRNSETRQPSAASEARGALIAALRARSGARHWMESPVTLHAKRKAGQLVTNLVKSNLNHAARPAPRRLIAGLAGCPTTKPTRPRHHSPRASGEAELRQ
jgi:hypothetical protein